MSNPRRHTVVATHPSQRACRRHRRLLLAGLLALALAGCGGEQSTPDAPDVNQDAPDAGGGTTGGDVPDGTGGDPGAPDPGGDTTAPAPIPDIRLERAFRNLTFSAPLGMVQPPGDSGRWFLIERDGVVRVFDNLEGAAASTVALDLTGVVNTSGEGGLLGIAFHPQFQSNAEVYLYYTRAGGGSGGPLDTVVSRLTLTGGTTPSLDDEEILLELDQFAANHNGGDIHFGPDGMLYIGLGDGGGSNDPQDNGQDPTTLLGAMLRIDVTSEPPAGSSYVIPSDNPFGGGGAPEVYAYGLRNPFRWSFDMSTGRLWLGDVGQGDWEEVNLIEAGANYGWDVCEGAHVAGGTAPCNNPDLTDPIAEYSSRNNRGNCAVTGGYVYRGSDVAELDGVYLYGDFCSGIVWGLRPDPAGGPPQVRELLTGTESGLAGGLAAFAQDQDGEVYLLDLREGGIFRVVPAP